MLHKIIALREDRNILRKTQIDTNATFSSDCEKLFDEYDALLSFISLNKDGLDSPVFKRTYSGVKILIKAKRTKPETLNQQLEKLQNSLLSKLKENPDAFVKMALSRTNVRSWLSELITFDFSNKTPEHARPAGFDVDTSRNLLVAILAAEKTIKQWERITPRELSYPFFASKINLKLESNQFLAERFTEFANQAINNFLVNGNDGKNFQVIAKLLQSYPEKMSSHIVDLLKSKYGYGTKLIEANDLEKLSVLRLALLLRNPKDNNFRLIGENLYKQIPLEKSPLNLVKSDMLIFLNALNGHLPSDDLIITEEFVTVANSTSLQRKNIANQEHLGKFSLNFSLSTKTPYDTYSEKTKNDFFNPEKVNATLLNELSKAIAGIQ
ncbi:MAG: hypothetical protein PHF25_08595 [Candidatus Margulisbacteria bacterium]|nr:hypothetical protein [Candidatus Margulisiibacteriota bacterium]